MRWAVVAAGGLVAGLAVAIAVWAGRLALSIVVAWLVATS